MTNRCRKVCCLALAIVLVFTLLLVLGLSLQQATPRDPTHVYDEIRLGDPAAHAVSLLRSPPGDFRTNSRVTYVYSQPNYDPLKDHSSWQKLCWTFDQCEVDVFVNEDGLIVEKEIRRGPAIERPFWVVLTDFFGL